MPEGEEQQDCKRPEQVSLDTRASIFQETFKHYFEMAMDHHTKAATTSNFLLIIVGAVIGLISLDDKISGVMDFISGLAVFVIGLFGALWTWKQHERYYFWQHIAYEYQKKLKEIVPGLKTGEEHYQIARAVATKRYGTLFTKNIHERWLWVSLHGIVTIFGLWLMALAI
jgi:uncharacterized membrane protein YiaA